MGRVVGWCWGAAVPLLPCAPQTVDVSLVTSESFGSRQGYARARGAVSVCVCVTHSVIRPEALRASAGAVFLQKGACWR